MNMATKPEITRFVRVKDVITPFETLEKAAEEAHEYDWMRAGDNVHICKHGDKIYPLILREIDGVLEIACGCEAWKYSHENDGCKHTAAFLKRSTPPQKPITDEIAKELMAAGWTGGKGNLRPPGMTSDDESDPTPAEPPKREPVAPPGLGATPHTDRNEPEAHKEDKKMEDKPAWNQEAWDKATQGNYATFDDNGVAVLIFTANDFEIGKPDKWGRTTYEFAVIQNNTAVIFQIGAMRLMAALKSVLPLEGKQIKVIRIGEGTGTQYRVEDITDTEAI